MQLGARFPPLKRVLSSSKGGLPIRITEVYTSITLDTELDDKLFVLPKERAR